MLDIESCLEAIRFFVDAAFYNAAIDWITTFYSPSLRDGSLDFHGVKD
jgi:hypothetical protein